MLSCSHAYGVTWSIFRSAALDFRRPHPETSSTKHTHTSDWKPLYICLYLFGVFAWNLKHFLK